MASPAPSIATSTGPAGLADSWVGVLHVPPEERVAARLAAPAAQASAAWPASLSATWVWPTGYGGAGPTVTGVAKPPRTVPESAMVADLVPQVTIAAPVEFTARFSAWPRAASVVT